MRTAQIGCAAVFLTWVCGNGASADELHVPSQYETIQQAIFAAQNGDEVVIAPGTYTGTNNWDINFLGKVITVRSVDPLDPSIVATTIIDCELQPHRGVVFTNGEPETSVLDGLTIRHGNSSSGAGIQITSGSPTIQHCIFTKCQSIQHGGAVYVAGASPRFISCLFDDNSAADEGGAAYMASGSSSFEKCVFTNNSCKQPAGDHGGAISNRGGTLRVINSAFLLNEAPKHGGAIFSTSSLAIINCLVRNNTADSGGAVSSSGPIDILNSTLVQNTGILQGGAVLVSGSSMDRNLINSLLWFNESVKGSQISLNSGYLRVRRSNVVGGQAAVDANAGSFLNWELGNIVADPNFVDPDTDDFRLRANSPCIDAGDNDALPLGVATDLDGNTRFFDDTGTPDSGLGNPPIVDMGAYEFMGTSTLDDEDDDGVPDSNDNCPGTIPGVEVDRFGCPPIIPGDLDRDGDVDQSDFGLMQRCFSGADVPADPACAS